MLYITLHNLHSWDKPHMTRAGDIAVATELSKAAETCVNVTAINQKDFEEIADLYSDARFKKKDSLEISKDLDSLTDQDIVLIPILEFTDLSNRDRRDQTLYFYQSLMKCDAEVAIMNIHHNKDFYLKQIENCKDREIAEAVESLLNRCVYIVHDECMKLSRFDSRFIEQIVYFDQKKIKSLTVPDLEGKTLSFYRPASFKGFSIWCEETKNRNDLVIVSNVKFNPRLKESLESVKDRCKIVEDLNVDLSKVDKNLIISSAYDTDSNEFERLTKSSKDCLNTTDYDYLRDLNNGSEVDYLIIENAMFEAVYAGLPLRWSSISISKMPRNARSEALMLNEMSLDEQVEYFKEKYNARKTVEYLKGLVK